IQIYEPASLIVGVKVEHEDESHDLQAAHSLIPGDAPAHTVKEEDTEQNEAADPNSTTVLETTTEETTEENAQAADTADPPLSKNKLKKLRRQEKWEAGRVERKAKRKEKEKQRKERRRLARDEAIKNGELESNLTKQLREKSCKQLPVSIILDCNYDDLMIDKERVSLSSQIARSYSDVGRGPYRCHLFISSFNKKLRERFDTVMHGHYKNWKNVVVTEEDYMHAAGLAREKMTGPRGGFMEGVFKGKEAKPEEGEVIYLSSDSPDTLTELKPYCTYVVGGLVDKNRHKGVCYGSALANGVKTAKLPIGDYIKMASRQVLTTNHVVEIMIRWLELGDWGKAFEMVIPKRKGGVFIGRDGESQEGQEHEDGVPSDEDESHVDEAREHAEAQDAAEESDAAETTA
ncbi:mitochondrial import inner membrane translocase subunit tim54, partial [Ascosphaera pollenicola]